MEFYDLIDFVLEMLLVGRMKFSCWPYFSHPYTDCNSCGFCSFVYRFRNKWTTQIPIVPNVCHPSTQFDTTLYQTSTEFM